MANINKAKAFIKNHSFGILVVLITALAVLSNYNPFDHRDNDYIRKLDSINKIQIATETALQEEIDRNDQLTNQLNQKEDSYYYEYINEKNRRMAAEKKLGAISTRVFNAAHLDSLADHVTYR